ncbi:MAG: glycoside hydrolase [Actinomycetota bacterium]|nr:glycoside hydrolase [Actinomycetota bacterium]
MTAVTAGMLLAAPAAEADLRVGKNFRMLTDTSPARLKDAVGLAVNPRNPRHIVAINAEWLRDACEYNVSFNGGRTWRSGDLRVPDGFSAPCKVGGHLASPIDGGVAFGKGNRVYATYASARVNAQNQEQGNSVLVARSTNGGRTFGTPVVALEGGPPVTQANAGEPVLGGPDYGLPKLAVERGRGKGGRDRVYVVAADGEASHEGNLRTENTAVTVSNNGGATWAPRSIANGDENAIEQSQPAIGRGGVVYVAWRTRGRAPCGVPPLNLRCPTVPAPGGGTTPLPAGTQVFSPEGHMVVGRSDDQGRTWTRVRTARVTGYQHECTSPNFPGCPGTPQSQQAVISFTASTFPRLATDPRSGNVHLVYGEGPPGPGAAQVRSSSRRRARKADHFIDPDLDVYYQRSTNGGAGFSAPRVINDPAPRPGSEVTQTRHPNVSVAPNGRVDITWQDRRHWYRGCVHTHGACQESRLGDTYYAYSRNRGASFSRTIRVTDRSINNDVGTDYRFGAYWDYGPVSVPLGRDRILFAWMDSRLGNYENDAMDIFLAELNLRARGPVPVRRVRGHDPIDLSVRLSRHAYPGGGESVLAATFASRPWTRVVIANHRAGGSVLAGGVLARGVLGPVLLSRASSLPGSVRREIRRLKPVGAYVVGTEQQLSPRVVSQLAALGVPADQVVRLSGSGPAGNAAAVAQAIDRRTSSERSAGAPAFNAAVIGNFGRPVDAAAASALAANRRLPVLYVDRNSVPQSTADALRSLGIRNTLVIGGSRSVSAGVMSQLPGPRRLGGNSARSVSRAITRESRIQGLPSNIAYVADRPIDAELLGAAVGRIGGLVVLSRNPARTAARAVRELRLSRILYRGLVHVQSRRR